MSTAAATVAVVIYARLTYRLFLEAREQTRASAAPVLDFAIADGRYQIRNIGRGPAMNTCVTDDKGTFTGMAPLGSIEAGGERRLHRSGIEQSVSHAYFLYYQDLWGTWHCTKFIAPNSQTADNLIFRVAVQRNLMVSNVPEYARRQADPTSDLDILCG